MNAISWIFRRLTQNEFKAITDQIQSEGGGSQTYIDLPKGKISDSDLTSFFGEGTPIDKGYKWEVPIYSLSLDMQPQEITISQRRDSSNCIREQNKEKRINIWKSEYSDFPNDAYNESENPIYIFILKSDDDNFYAGWFYAKDYKDDWFLTKNLCKPLFGESCGVAVFDTPICIDFSDFHWPFRSLSSTPVALPKKFIKKPRQVIYFGAPGTGKSHAVDKILKTEAPKRNIRTTFHPDSDYSSFVGCFKPTMKEGNIEYAFTAQAFVKAYIAAWTDTKSPFFLVIEEINRGNCAQIFGDIFQLLDRDISGESSYGIVPDNDLQTYISERLNLVPEIPADIAAGREMRLPSNLFIYATMNTSDQSLFPIDSAFKRRWDWRYTAIKSGDTDHIINVNGIKYNWTSFIRKVNEKILDLTKSEDKQLGYWFIKPDENHEISWELFVSKALFYIWNDVIKDYATMEKADFPFGRNYAFTTFFDENGEPLAARVIAFLEALGVEKILDSSALIDDDNSDDLEEVVDSEGNTTIRSKGGSKYSYTLDGLDFDGIGKAIQHIVNTLGKTKPYNEIEADFNRIVKKTYRKEPAIKPQLPSELNPDENGRNRWYVKPFTDVNGKQFSLISLWPDSYFSRIKEWVANYPDIFPGGFIQHETTD